MGSGDHTRGLVLLCLCLSIVTSESRDFNRGTTTTTARRLVEGQSISEPASTSHGTERIDPSATFKKYRGGYDITNKHYWSSAFFTGIYGYSFAILWLLMGIAYSGFLVKKRTCPSKIEEKNNTVFPCRRRCCFWPKTVVIFLTTVAIVASGVALTGSSKFHLKAISVKIIIAQAAEEASTMVHNITGSINTMEVITDLYSKSQESDSLNSTSEELNNEASRIQSKAKRNAQEISKGLKILQATIMVIICINIVMLVSLLGSGLLQFHKPFQIFLLLCWLCTALFWVYFGVYIFLDRFVGDTCVAIGEFSHDTHNSSLSSMIPCNDQVSAKLALQDTRGRIHDLINQVNANILELQPSSTLQYSRFVCNPFSEPPEYNYQPQNCSEDTISIGDIPQILKRYTCSNGNGGACGEGEFISTGDYIKVTSYTTSVQNLLNAFPDMERLVNCQMVKDVFADILSNHCKPLRKYIRTSWASILVLSTVMVLVIVIWALMAYHHGRHHSADGSMKPQSITAGGTEFCMRSVHTETT